MAQNFTRQLSIESLIRAPAPYFSQSSTWETLGEHIAESKVKKFLTRPQSAAIVNAMASNPVANATTLQRWLELLPDDALKISPCAARRGKSQGYCIDAVH